MPAKAQNVYVPCPECGQRRGEQAASRARHACRPRTSAVRPSAPPPRTKPATLSETAVSLAMSELRGARAATLYAAKEAEEAMSRLREAQRHTDEVLASLG
jgi:hypothetical protein